MNPPDIYEPEHEATFYEGLAASYEAVAEGFPEHSLGYDLNMAEAQKYRRTAERVRSAK